MVEVEYSTLNQVEEGLQEQEQELVPLFRPQPPIVKAVVTKETKQTAMGVGWHSPRGVGVKVWKLRTGGVAAVCSPELQVGMKLLRINNIDFQHSKSANDVVSTLSFLEGDVTIVVAADPNTFYSTVCMEERSSDEEYKWDDSKPSSGLGIEFTSTAGQDITIKSIPCFFPFCTKEKRTENPCW
jgi:hypothetical protein